MVTQSASAIQIGTAPTHRSQALMRPSPLLAVLRWELRRLIASRGTWVSVALVFGMSLLLLRLTTQTVDFSVSTRLSTSETHAFRDALAWTSLWGLAALLPLPAVIFGLIIPFVTSDGVSRDLKRQTHELVMATALPSEAYIWGRYLAGMVVNLSLAVVFLAATVVMALALHMTQGSIYPALILPGAIAVWAVVLLPTTVLLSSVSFALGTLFPRRVNLIKAGVLFVWFACGTLLPDHLQQLLQQDAGYRQGHTPAWWTAYATWDPTSIPAGSAVVLHQFFDRLFAVIDNAALSNEAVAQQARVLERQMPDLAPLVGPHLLWVAASLAAVAGTALAFRRFRSATG